NTVSQGSAGALHLYKHQKMSHYGNRRDRGNKVFFGILIIIIGLFIFLKQVGLMPMLDFHANWPLFLIAIGILLGIKKRFASPAPFILIATGVFNYIQGFTFSLAGREVDSERLVVPLLFILAGLIIVFKPKKKHCRQHMDIMHMTSDKTLEADIVFGGRKEII